MNKNEVRFDNVSEEYKEDVISSLNRMLEREEIKNDANE